MMSGHVETITTAKTSLLRRIGIAGFLFFFAKGLLWLIVPAVVVALT
jgi:hypothetical protein